jgi:hypothetical protein
MQLCTRPRPRTETETETDSRPRPSMARPRPDFSVSIPRPQREHPALLIIRVNLYTISVFDQLSIIIIINHISRQNKLEFMHILKFTVRLKD